MAKNPKGYLEEYINYKKNDYRDSEKEAVRMSINRKALLALISIIMLVFTVTACDSQETSVKNASGSGEEAGAVAQDTASPEAEEKPMFVDILSATSPISPGGTPVTLFAKTKSGAICDIKVGYKGGTNEANALFSKQAETNGLISWTWVIDSSVAFGKYPVTVTAKSLDGQVATAETTIEVKSAEECKK